MSIKSMLLAAGAAALVAGAAAPALATPGLVSFSNPQVWSNSDDEDYSLGWKFSTTGETVSALGYNDYGFNASHLVGIYDAGGTLLASATVTGASTLSGGYRYTNLVSPLLLAAGEYYIVGTTKGLNDGWIYQADSIVTNAATTYLGSYYGGGGGVLAFPDISASDRQYLEVNFETSALGGGVPEPATWALMLIGFGAIGLTVRGRRAQLA